MELNTLKTHVDSNENGAWFTFGDAKLKIARWMNNGHAQYLREAYATNKRALEQNTMTDKEAQLLLAKQWTFILTDWEGLTENGDEIPYSEEKVIELVTAGIYVDLLRDIKEVADDEMNYREEVLLDLGKI